MEITIQIFESSQFLVNSDMEIGIVCSLTIVSEPPDPANVNNSLWLYHRCTSHYNFICEVKTIFFFRFERPQ
jgi:hypothetical protein